MFNESFSFQWAVDHLNFLTLKRKNMQSYKIVINDKVISKSMAEKCAASGLIFDHIRLAYGRKGREGVTTVLGEKCCGKVRVTKRKQVIEKSCLYFEK